MPGNDQPCRFDARYRTTGQDVFLDIERAVLGVDYQATGYTTRHEAEEMGRRLELDGTSTLLDLGSGCGFPGHHLATTTGCSVVSVDPVASGATAAADRARRDGLSGRVSAVVARGQELPVRSGSFDAVVHVDVIC
jgi:cyclopropane fatty-acyl-phospholipid synthase-like methyltransferase